MWNLQRMKLVIHVMYWLPSQLGYDIQCSLILTSHPSPIATNALSSGTQNLGALVFFFMLNASYHCQFTSTGFVSITLSSSSLMLLDANGARPNRHSARITITNNKFSIAKKSESSFGL